jgi:hypothetical protein
MIFLWSKDYTIRTHFKIQIPTMMNHSRSILVDLGYFSMIVQSNNLLPVIASILITITMLIIIKLDYPTIHELVIVRGRD